MSLGNLGRGDIVPFLKFGIIGVVNTALHSACVILLHGRLGLPVVPAHVAAFVLVNAFSFLLNSHLVFHQRPRFGTYLRFLAVSLFSLAATVLIAGAGEIADLDYRIGLVLVILVAPPVTYLLQKGFAFRSR